ncbi:hypothetical protein [Streptosporangium sp. NPDC087985]|uniref:hypothetical protein n=1 Tax=Streptosporangium sp. NPDC087985 TaxID=3366196 RepID=UPI0038033F1C
MAARTPEARRRAASIAADVQWAMTPNRTERTEAARRASPMSLDYWVAKTKAEGIVRDQDVQKAAENAYRAHMKQMSLKAARSRQARAAAARMPREGLRKSA